MEKPPSYLHSLRLDMKRFRFATPQFHPEYKWKCLAYECSTSPDSSRFPQTFRCCRRTQDWDGSFSGADQRPDKSAHAGLRGEHLPLCSMRTCAPTSSSITGRISSNTLVRLKLVSLCSLIRLIQSLYCHGNAENVCVADEHPASSSKQLQLIYL